MTAAELQKLLLLDAEKKATEFTVAWANNMTGEEYEAIHWANRKGVQQRDSDICALVEALEWITDYGDIHDIHARKAKEALQKFYSKLEGK